MTTPRGKAGAGRDKPTLFVAEPPAIYRIEPPLVVDCSMLCALLFQETERDEAQAQLAARTLLAPALLDYELANVALKKARQGAAPLAQHALAAYAAMAISLHGIDPVAVLAMAHRYGLSAYDAAYLWLASQMKAPLATFDRKLGEAARQHLGALE